VRHKAVYTTGEAATICNLSQQTIIRCFDSGQLQALCRTVLSPAKNQGSNVPADGCTSSHTARAVRQSVDSCFHSTPQTLHFSNPM